MMPTVEKSVSLSTDWIFMDGQNTLRANEVKWEYFDVAHWTVLHYFREHLQCIINWFDETAFCGLEWNGGWTVAGFIG